MGNFSYISENRGEAVKNPWREETLCELQFIQGGVVVESMRGTYSGYGAVLVEDGYTFVHKVLRDGVMVDITQETLDRVAAGGKSFDGDVWVTKGWCDMVNDHFNDGEGDGFAAWHLRDLEQAVPHSTVASDNDPGQGDFDEEDDEDEEEEECDYRWL